MNSFDSESSLSLMESGAATQTQSGAAIVSRARPQMHQLSIAAYGFTILSGIVGLLQLVNEGPPIFSVYVFICLFAFSASMALSPSHSSICIHISFFFGILASASFLSLAVPNKLSWAPYLSCTYPALHLLSADFRLSLQESCRNGWNAAIDAASRAHQALRSCVRPRSGSSPSSAGSLEEGCSHGDVNGVLGNHLWVTHKASILMSVVTSVKLLVISCVINRIMKSKIPCCFLHQGNPTVWLELLV